MVILQDSRHPVARACSVTLNLPRCLQHVSLKSSSVRPAGASRPGQHALWLCRSNKLGGVLQGEDAQEDKAPAQLMSAIFGFQSTQGGTGRGTGPDGDTLDVNPLASPAADVANTAMPSATAAAARANDACTEGGQGPRRGGRARTMPNCVHARWVNYP